MEQVVPGNFQQPGSAQSFAALARLRNDGTIELTVEPDATLNRECPPGEYSFGSEIPGLAVEIHFADGAVFTPSSDDTRWQGRRKHGILAFLESNLLTVAVAAVLAPLLVWWLVAVGIPKAAVASVAMIPDSVPQKMGRETFYMLDKFIFDASALPEAEQNRVRALWLTTLERLGLPGERFALHFRSADMAANALALPDGTVIVTDDLVKLLNGKPDALVSVLLHEIGHVEHRHSLKLVAQSVATSVFFAAFFGDIQGAGDIIIGASSSLLQNAYSRNMEADADEYAFRELIRLGISPAAFADALEALDHAHHRNDENHTDGTTTDSDESRNRSSTTGSADQPAPLEYLSTHPLSRRRITAARERAEAAGF